MHKEFTGLHEECGVMGVYAPGRADVAQCAYFGLYALQHRGCIEYFTNVQHCYGYKVVQI